MNLKSWYEKRGPRFILERAQRLNQRYGLHPDKAMRRVEHCLEQLAEWNCAPTFAVPGMVVERNPEFIRRLQEQGAEIAVHSYNHIDLKACSPEEGRQQMIQAAEVFRRAGVAVHGFRCPYLSMTNSLYNGYPQGLFEYSSNRAVQWPVGQAPEDAKRVMFETILEFYQPMQAGDQPCLPWSEGQLLEIPVSVPDDLQLHDGLGYNLNQVSTVWEDILARTYQRGEIFNLMFHPELAAFCEAPFVSTLKCAQSLQPGIWVARLSDISAWWKEKSTFRVDVCPEVGGFSLRFECSPRATLVARELEVQASSQPWYGPYKRLNPIDLYYGQALPLIGVPVSVPDWVVPFLSNQGYLVETGPLAQSCSIYLEPAWLEAHPTRMALIERIETESAPLIRFWPWPNGMRSALCVTGDLDALSLLDYAARLF